VAKKYANNREKLSRQTSGKFRPVWQCHGKRQKHKDSF
jgi:hypothetical protein